MQVAFDDLRCKLTSPPVLAFPDFEVPFIVETDASSVSVGAVLVQRKKKGKIHFIQFASRTMNELERNYSPCEWEALAVNFSLRKIHIYLLSFSPFKLITDYQALSYTFRKKDVHGRLACWLDFFGEHEFSIRFRRRSATVAAHYLSRIEGEPSLSVEDEGELSNTIMITEVEGEDLEPICRDVLQYLQRSNPERIEKGSRTQMKTTAKKFLAWEGHMFHSAIKGVQAVPLISERQLITKTFHDDIGHWGLDTTWQFVTNR